ncbi:MAG: GIY-YIG nuclease family protein [Phascolarctobacterium sp.]|nr:GIY-YIG nuclease family protein [Phascolarctobacterium sp.]
MPAYVYMLRCKDDSLYTGWTNDLQHRLKVHASGKGAKYTRGRGPLTLVYAEELVDKETAMKREWEIKSLTRTEKLALCAAWQQDK